MRLITSSHITDWANRDRADCQGILPLLVRRLVRATADSIDLIDFPSGDAVSDGGWDGRLRCLSHHPYVPQGVSGWEIGTDKSAPKKAASDYSKRSAEPLGLDPQATTFVFVTPRAWPGRHEWAGKCCNAKRWRDVKVVAASGLEEWLEDAPAVALWLARHLGIAPATGLTGIELWWERWGGSTDPAFTPAMLLAGRDAEAAIIDRWFSAGESKLEVQGDSIDEALAFLRAAASRWPNAAHEEFLARCVVAETEQAFDAAAALNVPAVIAAPADVARSASIAMRKRHRLYLAVGRTLASRGSGPVRLQRVDRHVLERALGDTGLPREDAAAIVADCGGSLAVLHRRRSAVDAVRRPSWASSSDGRALIPVLLAGAWSEAVRPTDFGPFGPPPPPLLDREVLSKLDGAADYETVVAPVRRYRAGDDSPFRHAAEIWRLTAALDAWYLLADQVQAKDLIKLADNSVAVLSLPDPKYELPDGEQWLAASRGKQRSHSEWLREGLAISLAVVAQRGDALKLPIPNNTAEGFVGRVVRRITDAAKDWRGWASLDDVLPVLAEAAPTSFLAAVEDLIEKQPAEVRELLSDGDGEGIMSDCRHAGLLWALERLAWHPDHLMRVVLLLAALDRIDPGGRWGNRPFSTLCEILLGPGDPYTFAGPDRCIEAVDALIAAMPGTAWCLLMAAASPMQSRFVRDPPLHLAARPDGWVPWTVEHRRVFWAAVSARVTSMVEGADDGRIEGALKHLPMLSPEAQRAVISWFDRRQLAPAVDDDDPLWKSVRSALQRVRAFGTAPQTMPWVADSLARIEATLAPTDPEVVARWLFGRRLPVLLESDAQDWQKNQECVRLARVDIVRRLLDEFGPTKLASWSDCLSDGQSFGIALATVATAAEDAALMIPLLSLARQDATHPPILLFWYAAYRSSEATWFEEWLAAAGEFQSKAPSAAICCALPFGPVTWRRVEQLGRETQEVYWKWVNGTPTADLTSDDLTHAAERMLAAGRALVVLDWVARRPASLLPANLLGQPALELIRYLNAIGRSIEENIVWQIERLFESLEKAGLSEKEVARLEWVYSPLLLPPDSARRPLKLHGLLAIDPAFFVKLICCVWKRDDDRPDEEDEAAENGAPATHQMAKARAHSAFQLLKSWHGPLPGQSDQDVKYHQLNVWVTEARRLCHEAGREQVGDVQLGRMLSHAPPDPVDGSWPHSAVRRVLSDLRSNDVDHGFIIGIKNGRGGTIRLPFDGGAQERKLADRYTAWANTMRSTAPYAARLLDGLSEHYRAEAKEEDAQADLNRLR